MCHTSGQEDGQREKQGLQPIPPPIDSDDDEDYEQIHNYNQDVEEEPDRAEQRLQLHHDYDQYHGRNYTQSNALSASTHTLPPPSQQTLHSMVQGQHVFPFAQHQTQIPALAGNSSTSQHNEALLARRYLDDIRTSQDKQQGHFLDTQTSSSTRQNSQPDLYSPYGPRVPEYERQQIDEPTSRVKRPYFRYPGNHTPFVETQQPNRGGGTSLPSVSGNFTQPHSLDKSRTVLPTQVQISTFFNSFKPAAKKEEIIASDLEQSQIKSATEETTLSHQDISESNYQKDLDNIFEAMGQARQKAMSLTDSSAQNQAQLGASTIASYEASTIPRDSEARKLLDQSAKSIPASATAYGRPPKAPAPLTESQIGQPPIPKTQELFKATSNSGQYGETAHDTSSINQIVVPLLYGESQSVQPSPSTSGNSFQTRLLGSQAVASTTFHRRRRPLYPSVVPLSSPPPTGAVTTDRDAFVTPSRTIPYGFNVVDGANGWKFVVRNGEEYPHYVSGGYVESPYDMYVNQYPPGDPRGVRPLPAIHPIPYHRCEFNLIRDSYGSNTGRCNVCKAMTRRCRGTNGVGSLYCDPNSSYEFVCGGCNIWFAH